MTDPIEDYLDDLTRRLQGSPAYVHRIVAESEEHLRDAADARIVAGMTRAEAETEALADFGAAGLVAREVNRATWLGSRVTVLRDLVESALRLIAVGMIVVGIAGAVARVVAAVTSTDAVFGLPASAHPSAADCARWLAIHPSVASCARAATLESSADQPAGMMAVGILGVLLLAALVGVRRHWPISTALPPMLAPAVAATAFGAAAAGMFALAISDVVILATWGVGLWWTCAACSLAAAVTAAVVALRALPGSSSDRGPV